MIFPDGSDWNENTTNQQFSSLKEVWEGDPVREISKKINNQSELSLSSDEDDFLPTEEFDRSYADITNINSRWKYDICDKSVEHMMKCKSCYKKLNKLVEKEVKSRCKDIIMKSQLKKVRTNENSFKTKEGFSLSTVSPSNNTLLICLIVIGIIIFTLLLVILFTRR